MGEEQQFCLRWNNFQANITSQFEALRDEEDFVDVTLACEGQRIKAHKVVLSACSPYFKELFRSNPCKHPILFMRDVEFRHLQSLIEFMYAGEVNVAQAHLSSFLRTAESLQIRGLTEAPQRHKQDSKSQPDNSPSSNSLIQQLINPRTQSASPKATSPASKSSQEDDDENNDDDDDVLSMSSSLSPPPTKRAREEEESTSQHPASSVAQTPDALQQDVESAYKDASPELFEPKLEAPDYGSDEESKGNFLGLDNSMLDNTFSALQGGLDMLAGPSAQGYTGDPIHDAALGRRGLRAPKRRRPMLRPPVAPLQGARYTTAASSASAAAAAAAAAAVMPTAPVNFQAMVVLGEGVEVPGHELRSLNREDYRKMTRSLATLLFDQHELATRSVTGQRWSRAYLIGGRPIKPALDQNKIQAILSYVSARFPMVETSKIKQVLAYKCKEAACSQRTKFMKTHGCRL